MTLLISIFLILGFCSLSSFLQSFGCYSTSCLFASFFQPHVPNPKSFFLKFSKCHHLDFKVHITKMNKFPHQAKSSNRWTYLQLADLRSVGISGAPLNFVDSNSFNRIFTMGPMGKNIFHNFTQNTSSSIFFVFCPLMTLSEPTWMVH